MHRERNASSSQKTCFLYLHYRKTNEQKKHFRMSKELHLHHFSLDSKGLCGHMVLQRKNYGPQLRVVYFCRMHHKELFSGNEFLFLRSTNQNTAPSLIQIYTHNARPHPQYVSQTSSKRLKAKPFSKDLIRHNSIKSLCIRNFITFSFPFIKQFQLKDDVIIQRAISVHCSPYLKE